MLLRKVEHANSTFKKSRTCNWHLVVSLKVSNFYYQLFDHVKLDHIYGFVTLWDFL